MSCQSYFAACAIVIFHDSRVSVLGYVALGIQAGISGVVRRGSLHSEPFLVPRTERFDVHLSGRLSVSVNQTVERPVEHPYPNGNRFRGYPDVRSRF